MTTTTTTTRPRFRRTAMAAVIAVAVIAISSCSPQSGSAGPLKVGSLTDGVVAYVASPDRVPGANDWNCKPTVAHPRPVVLVHGTAENMGFNWAALSPMLKNAGYCVFAINHGEGILSLFGRVNGLGPVAGLANEVNGFIDNVLAVTGASQVDFVGHAQGGLIGTYYAKRLGGASKVGTMVQISPSNHGTTLSGLTSLGSALGLLGIANIVLGAATPSLVDQQGGSPFQNALFADGDVVAGPHYVVIQSTHDEVVTPYTNAFLSGPNVTNILIQDQCPNDPTGHIGIVFDQPALANVLNVLGPNTPGFTASCTGYGIGL